MGTPLPINLKVPTLMLTSGSPPSDSSTCATGGFLRLGVGILVLAAVLLAGSALVPFAVVRQWFDQQAGDGSADPYTPELHLRLILAAGVTSLLLLIVAASVWRFAAEMSQAICRGAQSLTELWWNLWPQDRQILWGMLVTGVVACGVRYPYLQEPMRFDESYTYLQYASQPLYVTLSKYDAPNNHVAHSVLVWGSTRLFGNSAVAIRLPAFLAGVLTAVAACWLAGRWGGPPAAVLTGFVISVWSPLAEYSVNARGYAPLHLLVLLILLVADEWLARPRRSAAVLLGILGALALWTIPTALFVLIMLCASLWTSTLWETIPDRQRPGWQDLLLAGAVCLGTAGVLYLPILLVSGWQSLIPGKPDPAAWNWFANMSQLLSETRALLLRDQSGWSCGLLALGWLLAMRSAHPRLRWLARTWPLGMGCCALLVMRQGVAPPARTWLFLIPWMVPLATAGLCEALGHFRRASLRDIGLLAVGWVCVFGPLLELRRNDSLRSSRETGVCPDAEAIIRDLKPRLQGTEPILAVSPTSALLVYYALNEGLDPRHFDPVRLDASIPPTAYIVVSRTPPQSISAVLKELQLMQVYGIATAAEMSSFPSAIVYRLEPLR